MATPTFGFTVSAPKLRADAYRVEFLAANRKLGKALAAEFDKTTKTWEGEKPTFEPVTSLTGGSGSTLDIAMTGSAKGAQKWRWLDEGTEPHDIRPKNARALAFPSGYQAKTTPGFVGSGPGGPVGPVVFSQGVHHPGTAARGWSVLIKKDFEPKYRAGMQDALRAGTARATKG